MSFWNFITTQQTQCKSLHYYVNQPLASITNLYTLCFFFILSDRITLCLTALKEAHRVYNTTY